MRRILFLSLFVFVAPPGCQRADVKDYVPADEVARQALTTALDAWKAGKTLDQIGATSPAVNVQDIQWRDGKKLTAYEIVGPAASDDQNRRFTVKLTFQGAAAPVETTYVVLGKDPIWVFSAESYQRTSGL
ncbi:MAG TPA: hypothetical protein VNH11_21025 [Pirellulales bacterium]|nr:hypothetical protein [Pirellulales bacterium]